MLWKAGYISGFPEHQSLRGGLSIGLRSELGQRLRWEDDGGTTPSKKGTHDARAKLYEINEDREKLTSLNSTSTDIDDSPFGACISPNA